MAITDKAQNIATSFMERFFEGQAPDLGDIDKLCALCNPQENANHHKALQALYGVIIEGLSNDFSKNGMELGIKVLVKMICHIRQSPAGQEIDNLLNRIGIIEKAAFFQHYNELLNQPSFLKNEPRKIRKIILPSRITVGADIVLNSIFAQRLFQAFPNAEIVMMGPSHIPKIFHGYPHLSHCHVEYKRHGSLTDRILGWVDFYQTAQKEFYPLAPDETLVLDSDSRLTQLGLLPLAPPGRSLFFPSRYLDAADQSASLAQMANQWCDRQFGKRPFVWPKISLNPGICHYARNYKQSLKTSFFLVVSFGVGNNQNKRLSDQFEKQLILALLEMKNTVILLDSGTRDSGLKKVTRLLKICKENGCKTGFLYEKEMKNQPIGIFHGIIGFRGSIQALGSFIQEADGFFGYDSCCQHMASALGCPAVIAFAGAPNDRFYARWRSQGEKKITNTIRVDLEKNNDLLKLNNLISRIVYKFKAIRKNK